MIHNFKDFLKKFFHLNLVPFKMKKYDVFFLSLCRHLLYMYILLKLFDVFKINLIFYCGLKKLYLYVTKIVLNLIF